MLFPVQSAEIARRVTKAFRLSGKVGIDLDSLAVPGVQVLNVDQAAFRQDGLLAHLSGNTSTGGLPLQLAGIAIWNRTDFVASVERLRVTNGSAGGSSQIVAGPTPTEFIPSAWGFPPSGNRLITGEGLADSSTRKTQAVPIEILSTDVFTPGVDPYFREDIPLGASVEAVGMASFSIAPGSALLVYDLSTSARVLGFAASVKIWRGS